MSLKLQLLLLSSKVHLLRLILCSQHWWVMHIKTYNDMRNWIVWTEQILFQHLSFRTLDQQGHSKMLKMSSKLLLMHLCYFLHGMRINPCFKFWSLFLTTSESTSNMQHRFLPEHSSKSLLSMQITLCDVHWQYHMFNLRIRILFDQWTMCGSNLQWGLFQRCQQQLSSLPVSLQHLFKRQCVYFVSEWFPTEW